MLIEYYLTFFLNEQAQTVPISINREEVTGEVPRKVSLKKRNKTQRTKKLYQGRPKGQPLVTQETQ